MSKKQGTAVGFAPDSPEDRRRMDAMARTLGYESAGRWAKALVYEAINRGLSGPGSPNSSQPGHCGPPPSAPAVATTPRNPLLELIRARRAAEANARQSYASNPA